MVVEVREARPADAAAINAVVMACEQQGGGEMIDDRERHRLERFARGDRPEHWHCFLGTFDGEVVGLGTVARPIDPATDLVAELLVDPHARRRGIATALLRSMTAAAEKTDARRIIVWGRHANPGTYAFAATASFRWLRTLAVLGRPLLGIEPTPVPDGFVIRPLQDSDDEPLLARILGEAFGDTADEEWVPETIAERRRRSWYDAADVLIAADATGEVVGVHWTRRRTETMGEVHILGLVPSAHGRGLGRSLLNAGLVHLKSRGSEHVILWADDANEPAIHLYESGEFSVEYEDVAFGRRLNV